MGLAWLPTCTTLFTMDPSAYVGVHKYICFISSDRAAAVAQYRFRGASTPTARSYASAAGNNPLIGHALVGKPSRSKMCSHGQTRICRRASVWPHSEKLREAEPTLG